MSATARVPPRRPAHPAKDATKDPTKHATGAVRVGSPRVGARSVPTRPELRLVTGPLPSRTRSLRPDPRRRAPFVLLVLALLVGTTVGLLVLNTAIAVDSLKASSLRRENAKRVEQIQQLQRQVITGSTPQQIAAAAASAGLVPAGTPGHLVVEPDGSSTLRGTPSPASAAPPLPIPTAAPSSPAGGSPAPASSSAAPTGPVPTAPSDAPAGD